MHVSEEDDEASEHTPKVDENQESGKAAGVQIDSTALDRAEEVLPGQPSTEEPLAQAPPDDDVFAKLLNRALQQAAAKNADARITSSSVRKPERSPFAKWLIKTFGDRKKAS